MIIWNGTSSYRWYKNFFIQYGLTKKDNIEWMTNNQNETRFIECHQSSPKENFLD